MDSSRDSVYERDCGCIAKELDAATEAELDAVPTYEEVCKAIKKLKREKG